MKRVLIPKTTNQQSDDDLNSTILNSQNSNTDKSLEKRAVDAENDVKNQPNNIWIINSILSTIFSYTDFTDLIEFSTVCKRWNNSINPIIYKSIKLARRAAILNDIYGEETERATKIDLEVGECISNNLNYAHFIKELRYSETLNYQRTIEFFSTFNNLTKLAIYSVKYSQNEFLDMLLQLNKLQELELYDITIDGAINNESRTEIFQLPPTLKKLTLFRVISINSPEYLVKAINSHTNLVEFSFTLNDPSIRRPTTDCLIDFLEPFSKSYPSLRSLEFEYHSRSNIECIYNIFESNPQLTSIKFNVSSWNDSLMNHINQHLINLESFEFYEFSAVSDFSLPPSSKFIRPTKIKKLKLTLENLTQRSLMSILKNCPDLEELMLHYYRITDSNNDSLSFNLVNNTKIKKLELYIGDLNTFESILKSCPNLNDLKIALRKNWKPWIMAIGENCKKLKKLTFSRDHKPIGELLKDFCEMEFLTNSLSFKSTITHLTFDEFEFYDANVEYFESFNNLKFIKFIKLPWLSHKYISVNEYFEEINSKKDSWPNYKLITSQQRRSFGVTLIKVI